MRFRGAAVAAVMTTAMLAACAEPAVEDPGAPVGDTAGHGAGGAEAISFGSAVAQIRGHHLVSLELYQAGDFNAAAVHADHPISEILASVGSELEEHAPDVGARLEEALRGAFEAVAAQKPAADVTASFEQAAAVSQEALTAVAGGQAETPSFRGSVLAALLSTAAHEYEEAIGPKGVRLLVEYQDGYGFVREARRLYDEIAPDVREVDAEEADEIEEAFEVLEEALPGPKPPAQPAGVEEVESAAKLIGHELEETVDAAPAEESDPEEIVAEIEEMLDEIVEAYEAGDADAAAELSAEAYLENYEVIEAQVIEKAPEVNEELEPLLGADLRKQIMQGAPTKTIEDMVARAKELLTAALEAISEH